MNQRSALFNRPRPALAMLAFSLLALLAYWGWRLYPLVDVQPDEELPDVGSLFRYLLGLLFLMSCIGLLAHLTYRLAFRRWMLQPTQQGYYWSFLCGLAWVLFELLQIRTEQEPTFVDENMLISVLVTGIIVLYGLIADTIQSRRQHQQLIQQKTAAELTALKAHINPHFLFNVLNTIYNEAQRSENQSVADLIEQLAGIMRFTIQESARPTITIDQEFEFLEKYLALQRARLPQTEMVQLRTRLDWDGQATQIAPLLLIPFVENMFQYGISLVNPTLLTLAITVEDGRLHMQVINPMTKAGPKGSGTGIQNTRQRLLLLYPNRHTLSITQTDYVFSVTLEIDL